MSNIAQSLIEAESHPMATLGSRMSDFRKKSQKTQVALATVMGVQHSTYWRYENDQLLPPDDKLERFAEAVGTTVANLRYGIDQPNPAESVTVYDNEPHQAYVDYIAQGHAEALRLSKEDLAFMRGLNFRDGLTVSNLLVIASQLSSLAAAPERPEMAAARAKNDAAGVKRKVWKKK